MRTIFNAIFYKSSLFKNFKFGSIPLLSLKQATDLCQILLAFIYAALMHNDYYYFLMIFFSLQVLFADGKQLDPAELS